MQISLQLGESPPVTLFVREEACISPKVQFDGTPICDVESAAISALCEPVGFPPLAQAVVEGDRVAIAMGEGVRGAGEVVRAIVHVLREVEIPPSQVSVVVGSKEESLQLLEMLEDLTGEGLQVVVHNPEDNEGLVFVAAVDEKPLRLNRFLGEADVVIPVASARHLQGFDVRGPFAALFPRFSDAETIKAYQNAHRSGRKSGSLARREQTDRAGWLLGVTLVVESVPARGGGVAAVVAGEPGHVARDSSNWCERIWQLEIPERANLVVASLGGGAQEQTWDNVARALHAAGRATHASQSAIVICTELEQEPGRLLHVAADAQASEKHRQALARASGDEAAQAWELCQALERGPVYFMGKLSESTVEDLGMAPLANYEELTRLIARSGTCLIINDGQHAVPIVSE